MNVNKGAEGAENFRIGDFGHLKEAKTKPLKDQIHLLNQCIAVSDLEKNIDTFVGNIFSHRVTVSKTFLNFGMNVFDSIFITYNFV